MHLVQRFQSEPSFSSSAVTVRGMCNQNHGFGAASSSIALGNRSTTVPSRPISNIYPSFSTIIPMPSCGDIYRPRKLKSRWANSGAATPLETAGRNSQAATPPIIPLANTVGGGAGARVGGGESA